MNEAIILAGGFGTRLRHVVSNVPKPMAPVVGRPFLEYLLDHLASQGYSHVVLATGYMHEVVEGHFGTHYKNLRLDYAREESPLGTGGAIVNALAHCSQSSITILNGDTLFLADLSALRRLATEHSTRLAIVLRKVDNTARYGAVQTNPDGRITHFVEKGQAAGVGLINGGIYQIDRSLLTAYPLGTPFSFEQEVLQTLYQSEPFYALASEAYFIDIGIPTDYARAQIEFPSL